ncbi:MAG TPA: penicillin-binding protein, partial [Bacteroidetes bacterium]|nr:penicillin-binding protein [Bacteroidota bacterium]
MKYKFILIFIISFLAVLQATAQLGGRYAYTFLDQPISARLAALGGNRVSIADNDINVAFVNPSLISPGINNTLAFNYVNFFAGSNFGSFNYAHTFNKVGSFMGSIQFMDYGTF